MPSLTLLWLAAQRTTSDDFKVGEVTGLFLASISDNEDGGEEIVHLLKDNGYALDVILTRSSNACLTTLCYRRQCRCGCGAAARRLHSSLHRCYARQGAHGQVHHVQISSIALP
jgi:hypothetical protein